MFSSAFYDYIHKFARFCKIEISLEYNFELKDSVSHVSIYHRPMQIGVLRTINSFSNRFSSDISLGMDFSPSLYKKLRWLSDTSLDLSTLTSLEDLPKLQF